MILFAPNAIVIPATTWNHKLFTSAIQGISNTATIFGRLTPMQTEFNTIAVAMSALKGRKAVFLLSDGMENRGGSLVAAAQNLYAANPQMVLHIISLADSAEGLANLKTMANLHSDSLFIDASTVLYSDKAALDIVRTTLYVETMPSE